MKCERCGADLDLLEIFDCGRVFECSECAYILTLKEGFRRSSFTIRPRSTFISTIRGYRCKYTRASRP